MQADFAIITIREDEFEAVARRFPGTPKHGDVSGRSYLMGQVRTKDGKLCSVAVARCGEPGPQVAQQLARDIISDLTPSLILVVGIAGGVPDSDFTLGDVIVSSHIHDFGVSAYQPGKIEWDEKGGIHPAVGDIVSSLPMYSSWLNGWNTQEALDMVRPVLDREAFRDFDLSRFTEEDKSTIFVGDPPLSWQQKMMSSLKKYFGNPALLPGQPVYRTRSIASSGSLIHDPDILLQWLMNARGIRAIEMEAGGVFQAAQRLRENSYPVLSIRGISDIVGLRREDEWTAYACHSAAAFTYALLTANTAIFDNIWRRKPTANAPAREQANAPVVIKDDGSIKVYIIYDIEDQQYEGELEKHLKPLQRQGIISTFHSHQLNTDDPAEAVDPYLDAAQIVLLLVSPAFMNSDLNFDYEMKRAFKRRAAEGITIIPILLRDVDLVGTPIDGLEPLPQNRNPIATRSDPRRDEAWVEVAKAIHNLSRTMLAPPEDTDN